MTENFSNSKIAQFHSSTFSEENVLTLEVSVNDLPVMDMLDRKTHLGEPF